MIKAVIVDDEPKAIKSLSWELSNFKDEVTVVESFTCPNKALEYLNSKKPDCLFLDIQMPTMDGFSFLEKLDQDDLAIVITTAYNAYGVKALKHEAIDYLVKPIDSDDLKDSLLKIKKYIKRVSNSSDVEDILKKLNSQLGNKKIIINTDGKLLFLLPDEILYVESDGNYSTFNLSNNQKIVITKKLKEVDSLLPETEFFRIHNSYIINLNKIKAYIKNEAYVILESDHKIPVARQRKSDFLEKI